MSDQFSVFKNIRSLRAAARSFELNELKEYQSKFNEVIAERELFEEEKRQQEQQKKEKIKEYAELMQQDGLEPDEFMALYEELYRGKGKHTVQSEPKYAFKDKDGNEKTWAGRGRMPKELKEIVDSGGSIEQYLIENKA